MERAFGRHINFDERSRAFPIRGVVPENQVNRTWVCGVNLDQGPSSSCVGHAWAHEAATAPIANEVDSALAYQIYNRAQQLDAWAGEDYDGTSVIAGAKVVRELGYVDEYRWAFGLEDMILAVGHAGPVVVGTNWYSGMFEPVKGFVRPTGGSAGGHAYLVRGVNMKRGFFKIHNSWGKSWGRGGTAYISFEDMDKLLGEWGEVCVPLKRNRIPRQNILGEAA